ncbi:hypothetical protein O181_038745 [Austropuccinia psidii MF-1]|uniref:Uncharacterized protein n=1 Tax=Austropuccinia psidii MF-1 TaxID=1389203 RepID=A0A9Q3HEF6_9BASI|nr:hypothetical protein [Austropuccinia psidii MF-1]
MGRNRNNNTEYLPQENALAGYHGINERLQSQPELHSLRNKCNQNKKNKATIQPIEDSLHMDKKIQIQEHQFMEGKIPSSPQQYSSSRPYKPKASLSRTPQ